MSLASPPPAAALAALAVEDLSVRYGARLALDGLSFAVATGSVYALLGPNGAGKSSLVRCLLGEQRPAAGRALLFGGDVWRQRARLLAEVGVVPEEPDAPPAMNVRQLLLFCSRLYPRWDGAGATERLARFGVPLDVPFGRLSKGQKGQVSLTLALAPRPRLLILDDPTLGLDPLARRTVFEELIGELADRGTTVFLTTHDLAAVEGIADRVGILRGGRLLLDEELESLKRRFRRISFPLAPPAPPAEAGRAAALAALEPVAVAARGFRTEAVVARWDEARFAGAGPGHGEAEVSALTLEEIFLALVGGAGGVERAGAAGGAEAAGETRQAEAV
ncbi:MAG TPA: ATP-binding cassette domain-containing protein [Thermoanaerobaculia bacterium]|jgi:ABC-2 type transport system ATP-binding protein|nr:ATP-binding cassette domain-containing protein [Thermoanaerobaculia bacterium]